MDESLVFQVVNEGPPRVVRRLNDEWPREIRITGQFLEFICTNRVYEETIQLEKDEVTFMVADGRATYRLLEEDGDSRRAVLISHRRILD